MSEIYKMLFDEGLPWVLEEMKSMMQASLEDRVGDWFLYKDFTVLKIYGFTGEPYRLPDFLTPRIFALEFMRQRLHSEEEHFGALGNLQISNSLSRLALLFSRIKVPWCLLKSYWGAWNSKKSQRKIMILTI